MFVDKKAKATIRPPRKKKKKKDVSDGGGVVVSVEKKKKDKNFFKYIIPVIPPVSGDVVTATGTERLDSPPTQFCKSGGSHVFICVRRLCELRGCNASDGEKFCEW